MKPKTMILMVVAVVCGLGASYMTSRLLADREDQAPKVVERLPDKVTVLVAKKNLDVLTYIKNPKEYFVEHQVIKDDTWKDALTDWKSLEGKTLRRGLRKGVHLTAEDLGDGSPTLEVPSGHRAMGLRVTVEAIAGGFASLPGSRVDIIWTRRGGNDQSSFSKTLLQNVLVLAADNNKQRNDEGLAMPASVVTLALSPEDSRRAALAKENGTMHLVLREPGDKSVDEDDTTTVSDIVKGNKKEEPKVEPKEEIVKVPLAEEPELPKVVEKPRRTHVVWFRQGDKQWKEVFYLDDNGQVMPDDVARVEEGPPAPPQQPAPLPAPKGLRH